jgi:hypothetical protein
MRSLSLSERASPKKDSSQVHSGLIFEVCTTKALAECLIPTKSRLSQTLKDQTSGSEDNGDALEERDWGREAIVSKLGFLGYSLASIL